MYVMKRKKKKVIKKTNHYKGMQDYYKGMQNEHKETKLPERGKMNQKGCKLISNTQIPQQKDAKVQ